MSRCNANPCCSDPYNCKVPLPQDRTGLYHLNERRSEPEKPTSPPSPAATEQAGGEVEGWRLVPQALLDHLTKLSGYYIQQPPTPDYEFVNVCNGDLRVMANMIQTLPLPPPSPAATQSAPAELVWHSGGPPKPWAGEWFIAQTTYNDRVVLRSLPEEFTYDFETADHTYIKADKIKRWMQFPDSQFLEYRPAAAQSAVVSEAPDAALLKAMENGCWTLRCMDYPIADTGDADVGWEVIEHHMAKPNERVIAQGNTPRAALLAALSNPGASQ